MELLLKDFARVELTTKDPDHQFLYNKIFERFRLIQGQMMKIEEAVNGNEYISPKDVEQQRENYK